DYTLGDEIAEDDGYLHALFRRETSTRKGHDFELLPTRHGRGRYLGAVIGVRPVARDWWGEGEVKIFLDGDDAFPTIAGTGAEDYVCLWWRLQPYVSPLHGASLVSNGRTHTVPVSMYRWHLADTVVSHESMRVSVQQIGLHAMRENLPRSLQDYLVCLF